MNGVLAVASLGLAIVVRGVRLGDDFTSNVTAEGDMPEGGAWQYEATRQVIHENIGTCYDPQRPWSLQSLGAGQPAEWEAAFNEAVMRGRASGTSHAQTLERRLQSFGGLSKILPYHRAVALTSNRDTLIPEGQYLPDSHCFEFDYSSYRPGDPDPHGCAFFKKSFQPLQKMRRCIISKLNSSPTWLKYKAVADEIRADRKTGSMVGENTQVVGNDETTWNVDVAVLFDSIRRADEMVKQVSFKDWQNWPSGVIKEVERKIKRTVITKSRTSLLEAETVTAIREECFLVTADSIPDMPNGAEAFMLKNAMPCYQLMWDQVEVAGAPELPTSNAATMWDPAMKHPSRLDKEHYVPPICARAALSLVAEKQKRGGKYSMFHCLFKCPSWETCMAPKAFNCICLACCWQAALRRMCELNAGCCDSDRGTKVA
eukprot:TRINITY_DN3457_c0_g2_i1.p1 TRINITY_DN3457_c0_g2~~TRINITY_DN3457_c0_g2_i1.p1  ORF type:complete len:429 (-),score=45.21 TRINITY_DN3457_c0_g2_i1:350-1636(-)